MRDLSRLLIQPEGEYVERKSLWHGPSAGMRPRSRREVRDETAEIVAAFASADRGTLILGAEDNDATGHGYPADAVQDMLLTPARRLIPPQAGGDVVVWERRELLLFEVAAAELAVMVRGHGFPRRVHDEVVHESEEAINAIKARGRTESVELEPAPGLELELLDPDLVRAGQEAGGLSHLEPVDYLCERRLGACPSKRICLDAVCVS